MTEPQVDIADSVLVSAVCYFRDGSAIWDTIAAAAIRSTTRRDGTVALVLGTVQFDERSAEKRQQLFEKALSDLLVATLRAGVNASRLATDNTSLSLRVTLLPSSGQAGIVFGAGQLREWINLGADIYIDAMA